MATLSFTTPFHGNLQGSAVPVEIRTPKLSLVRIVNSSESTDLPRGTYVVKATLPAGQEIVRVVELADKSLRIELTPEDEDRSPHEYLESATYAASPRARAAQKEERRYEKTRGVASESTKEPSEPVAWIQCVTANVFLDQRVKPAPPPTLWPPDRDIVMADVPAASAPTFLQCFQPGRSVVNIALPISDRAGCRLIIRRSGDKFWIDPQLQNPDASLLLGYRQNRALQHEACKAEDLLREKLDDPIGAAIGSYSLLSFGELDKLHDWPRNLMSWMAWLPDGAALYGEHQARLGNHAAAIDAFLELEKRGLPIFTDGITMAHERLRLYTRITDLRWKAGQRKAAERLRDRIEKFIPFVDLHQPVTTFTGRHVTAPDDKTWTAKRAPAKSVAIHSAFA